jgi:hypothetical protein
MYAAYKELENLHAYLHLLLAPTYQLTKAKEHTLTLTYNAARLPKRILHKNEHK